MYFGKKAFFNYDHYLIYLLIDNIIYEFMTYQDWYSLVI